MRIKFCLSLCLIFFLSNHIVQAAPTDLFVPLPESVKPKLLSKKVALNEISSKEKNVGINSLALANIPSVLTIDLFGNVVTAVLSHTEKVSGKSISWIGHIDTDENQVILVISGSLIQGNIIYQNQQYQIRYKGKLGDTALHILRKVDATKLRNEHPPSFIKKMRDKTLKKTNRPARQEEPQIHKSTQADIQVDSNEFVDVMVLWTPTARQGAGGTTAITALIDLAFTETNQSYANSGITHRLRLTHKQEVNFTENISISTNLDRLRNSNDGYIDNIHTLRDTYKADLVSLFISIPGFYCGVADTPVGSFWDQAAFSVVDYQCAVNNNSFAHETGHNFSAMHDWRTDTQTSVYPYSHGHLHDGINSWRTIMSYYKCTGSGSCTRLNYWSNPEKIYNGIAMGVAEGAVQAADNRKALNNAASFVANYRVSGTGSSTSFNFDIDGNGQAEALTDGLLTLRYIFGFTGTALTDNAVSTNATRNTFTDIQTYLQTGVSSGALDIDDNGDVHALTDGLLVLRYLFGFTGDALIDNAIGDSANRSSANDIEVYLQSKMP